MTQRQRKSKAKVKRARHKRVRVEHSQVSIYDLLGAYADVIKRKVGKHPALAASYGKRKKK